MKVIRRLLSRGLLLSVYATQLYYSKTLFCTYFFGYSVYAHNSITQQPLLFWFWFCSWRPYCRYMHTTLLLNNNTNLICFVYLLQCYTTDNRHVLHIWGKDLLLSVYAHKYITQQHHFVSIFTLIFVNTFCFGFESLYLLLEAYLILSVLTHNTIY